MACLRGKDFRFTLGNKTLVMGILNYTPDSFSDGGLWFTPESAVKRAQEMERLGADIIDIGACSTAPGTPPVSESEELNRLGAVLPAVIDAVSVPVSVDTFRFNSMCLALEFGALIINDESGCFSEDTAELIMREKAGWVIMHTGGLSSGDCAEYKDVCDEVGGFFSDCLARAVGLGLSPSQLCFDPGIGFGKSRNDDRVLIRNVGSVCPRGVASLLGVSRKRVITKEIGIDNTEQADYATSAANAIGIAAGADIIRVHNVAAGVACARAADKIIRI